MSIIYIAKLNGQRKKILQLSFTFTGAAIENRRHQGVTNGFLFLRFLGGECKNKSENFNTTITRIPNGK